MPYEIVKRGKSWLTINKKTKKIKGTHTSRDKAVAQMSLLYGIEKGMEPTGEKGKSFRLRASKKRVSGRR